MSTDVVLAAIGSIVGLVVLSFAIVKTIRDPLQCEIEKLREHTGNQYDKIEADAKTAALEARGLSERLVAVETRQECNSERRERCERPES